MALGFHGKKRMGQRGGATKPSQHDVSGPMPAVGGPRPDRTARWPGNPGKENSAPGSRLGLPLVKTFVAGSYMPGNPHGGKSRAKVKAAFHEVFTDEPSTVTRANVSGERKHKMKVVIALNKARKAGARIPKR